MRRYLGLGLGARRRARPARSAQLPATANPSGTGLVISQVYGGGGNSGATLQNDYVELFNPTTSPSRSPAGASSTRARPDRELLGSVTALPRLARTRASTTSSRSSGGRERRTAADADATGDDRDERDRAGKVIARQHDDRLALQRQLDAVLVGPAARSSTSSATARRELLRGQRPGAGAVATTTADFRANGGCTDTDDNGADFAAGAPTPRNTASPIHALQRPDRADRHRRGDARLGAGRRLDASSPSRSRPARTRRAPGSRSACDLTAIGGSATQRSFDNGTNGDATAGDATFSYSTAVPRPRPGRKSLPVHRLRRAGPLERGRRSRSRSRARSLAIHDIQGAAHISPHAGQVVSTNGHRDRRARRTASGSQDPSPDANDATSEGIFVFTSSRADRRGRRRRPRERARAGVPARAARRNANLTTTELASPTVTVVSTGNPLPAPRRRRHRRARPAEHGDRGRRDGQTSRRAASSTRRATGSTSGRASRACASS